MNKTIFLFFILIILAGCKSNIGNNRIPVAEVGKVILYYDEIPDIMRHSDSGADSVAVIQSYVNKWAKRQLMLKKAEENLTPEKKYEIDKQLLETKINLLIYEYQQQMILEKLDTVITDQELRNYYSANSSSLLLNTNIVKALFIKIPVEAPNLNKIKILLRSDKQHDLRDLESYCYQFADKFDDFNEEWIPMNQLTTVLNQTIENEENFLLKNKFYESKDSSSVYLVAVRDFRLRSSIAPFDYVKNDIKRIIWNTRRFEYLQSLENGIYNQALKENSFKIY